MLGFRQRPLNSWLRRLRIRLVGLLSNRPPNSQRIYVVTIHGHRYKRIVFPDSHQAEKVAVNLGTFGDAGIYPRLVMERENELWVEFIEGRPLREVDSAVIERFADLFAVLYTRDPERVPIERTPFAHALRTNLDFLADVGVLARPDQRRLVEVAEREAPKEVWVGYDCTDAILKNFVVDPEGRVRGVDVESLGAKQLIGSGVAKACVRWLEPHREPFLELLQQRGAPDFQSYLKFVELSFIAFWLKSSFLEKKRGFVDAGLFDRFLAG